MAGSDAMETIATTPALEFAPYIILLPMLAFPVILFLGKIFNGNKMWKDGLKEGGLIALPVMAASLLLALWLVTDFVGGPVVPTRADGRGSPPACGIPVKPPFPKSTSDSAFTLTTSR